MRAQNKIAILYHASLSNTIKGNRKTCASFLTDRVGDPAIGCC